MIIKLMTVIMLVFNPTMTSPLSHHHKICHDHGEIFSYYGFSDRKQQKALIEVLSDTGIDVPHTMDDAWIHHLIVLTQKKWVRRTHGQDRWHVQHEPRARMRHPKRLLDNLNSLGFVLPIRPIIQKTDVLCIFGARGSTMEKRIQYAQQWVSNGLKVGQVVLLAGERPVDVEVDGSEKTLMELARKCGVSHWKYLTETHLIENIWHQSALSRQLSRHNIPVTTLDTPRGLLPRPTTQTTMLQFIAFLKKNPHVRHVTFVSNQPHVAYQCALIDAVLQSKGVALSYQVIGEGIHPTSRDVGWILAEMGSYLWAKTPDVLRQMKGSHALLKTKAPSWHHVYAHNPILHHHLPVELQNP